MFGYIRFILAYMVLLSHMNYKFLGHNIGVFAVVFFYILAGLVTSKVFIKIAPKDSQISYFIKDRFLRIYPTYLFALLITILFFCATNYLEPNFSFKNLFYHLSIIPLNYFFCLDIKIFDAPIGLNFLIPPAWSLGAELQAYFLLVIAIKFKRLGLILALISFIIFCVANLGYIDSDIYGYRTVCGVFFIFYTGFLIFQREHKTLALFYIGIILLFTFLIYKNKFGIFSVEIVTGYLLGVLLVLTHEKFKFKLKFNEILGSLSYSLFISHFLFIWISEYVFDIQNLYFITLGSIVFGLVNYYLIENRINKIRFHNK